MRGSRMLGGLVFALCCTAVLAAEQIHIGVLGVPRLQAAPNRWQPLAAALHAVIPAYDFQISTLDETALGQAVRQRQVDFILTTAANYIVIESQSGLSAPLASLVELAGDTQLPVSGGVIFTRAASGPLHSLPWLANRSIAYVRSAEIGSYLAQAYEMFGAGMTPPPRSIGALALPSDAEVVNAVLSGRAQAGFVPAGVLERMAAHGQLDWATIRLVNEQRLPAFPFKVSTRLYPGWVWAALPHLDSDVQRQVVQFLLGIESNTALAGRLGIHGFDLPANIGVIDSVLREMRAPPYDQTPDFTFRDVWARYAVFLVLGTLGFLSLALMGVFLKRANRQLTQKQAFVASQARQLEAGNRLLNSIIDNIPVMISLKDAKDLRFEMVNQTGERLMGIGREALLGKSDYDFFPPDQAEQLQKLDRETLAKRGAVDVSEAPLISETGSCILHTKKIALLDRDGVPTHLLGISEDITERRRAEQEIESLAFYDSLTQLPNRRLYGDRLRQAIMASARNGRDVGVLLIDLDNFKTLNDTRGHAMGDLLLTQVARRLTCVVRDIDTVARLGGDEFVVVLGELSEDPMEAATQTRHIGEKLLAAVNATFDLDGFTVATSASIGATLLAHRHIGGDELQREADIAMYQAKKAGRNALCFFDNDMQMAVLSRAGLELDITRALSEQQFTLHYQPQVHADGRVVGLEALLRWPHPKRGMVSPVEFVPLAEETGQIIALGHWVMQTACRQLAAWRHHPQLAGVPIAVNVSAKQFALYHFVEDVQALLAQTGAAPDMLKLELTESLLLESYADVTARMRALKVGGIRFSIDDFGTGYSSLSYLKRLPLDQLKIDQSFVRDVLQDDQVAAIARTIIALADSLSLEVIAEGVETEAQRDFLRDAGCLRYQGYYFGRPMPADAVEAYMAARCQAGAADMA